MENNENVIYFTDPLILAYVTQYLTIPEQLTLTTLNKIIRARMDHHFRVTILQHHLTPIPKKSHIHQMNFYFGRCLTHLRPPKPQEALPPYSLQNKLKRKMTEEEVKVKRKMT